MSNLIKKILVYAVTIVLFAGIGTYTYKSYVKVSEERDRFKRNWENSNFEVQVRETKNKELAYSVNSLTVKASELKNINTRLYSEIDNLRLEAKRLQALTEIKWQLEQRIDTIYSAELPTIVLGNNEFDFTYKDAWTDVNGKIIIPEKYAYNKITQFVSDDAKNKILESLEIANPGIARIINNPRTASKPYINNLKYTVNDSLIVIPEFQYKRSWIFWKKVTGVKVHVKSQNPNFKVDQMESYQIMK